MLNLMEEILLLALKEEKGTLAYYAAIGIDPCLTGAILIELELLRRIRVDKKTLEIIDRTPTQNPRLDNALRQIDSSKKHHPPHYWVSKLRSTMKGLRKELLQELADKCLVREEEHQFLLFFTTTRYPLRDIRTKKDLHDRLYKILLRGETPNNRTLKLIGLIQACNLTDTLVDKEDRKDARKKAKELSNGDPLIDAVKKVIQSSASAASTASF